MKSSENSVALIATVFPKGREVFCPILAVSFGFPANKQDITHYFLEVKIHIRLSS